MKGLFFSTKSESETISWKTVFGTVSTVFSFAFLFLAPGWVKFMASSGYIAVACLIGIIICVCNDNKEWSSPLLYFLSPLLFVSIIAAGWSIYESKQSKKLELRADATESIIYDAVISSNHPSWVQSALESGTFVSFLVLAEECEDTVRFIHDITKPGMSEIASNEANTVLSTREIEILSVSTYFQELRSKYLVGYANSIYLKDDWRDKVHEQLPESVNEALLGALCLYEYNEWEEARRHFEQSDALGNPAGTYYLSRWYSIGFGQEPDIDKGNNYLEKAADSGSRSARFEWSQSSLYSPLFNKAKAEDYLQKAARISGTCATFLTTEYSLKSIDLLHRYYHVRKQRIKAFLTTWTYLRSIDDKSIKYSYHLENCLRLFLYKEALRIVLKGEKDKSDYCTYVHGVMYLNGKAERKDLKRAEDCFRYAADSLGYSGAYYGLYELYKELDRPGAGFWKLLDDVNFSSRLPNEK